MPHNQLGPVISKSEVTNICSYKDGAGKEHFTWMDVTWEIHFNDHGWAEGEIIVNKGAGIAGQTWVLSLYSIGLQGRLWGTTLEAAPGKFEIMENDGTTPRAPTGNVYPIEMTDVVGDTNAKKHPPDHSKILFIKFTDSRVTLKARSKRLRHIKTRQGPYIMDDHDTSPPPPEPGGEEGDGEE